MDCIFTQIFFWLKYRTYRVLFAMDDMATDVIWILFSSVTDTLKFVNIECRSVDEAEVF